jgi:UDP-N-acetylmuramate dehydrogenase
MTDFLRDIPLADKTTFRIGGPARFYVEPDDDDGVAAALTRARKETLPLLVLGKGSNVLVSDRGWPGLVINLTKFTGTQWAGDTVTVRAGVLLDTLVRETIRRGSAGMEELSGIPGTVGGAVVMNAGAFSTCIADTLEQATYLDIDDHQTVTAGKDALGLGYRTSLLQKNHSVVLSAQFRLRPGAVAPLEEIRRTVLEKRRDKQPLDLPNCGSVFKRPPGGYAGALIEQAELKGLRYGNAEISSKHANFIVNRGNATASDVRHLIVVAQKTVYAEFGILLEPEVVFAGEFEEELYKP